MRHKHIFQVWKVEFDSPMILRTLIIILAASLNASCVILRSDIDKSCVDRFADQYPPPRDSQFVLPWARGQTFLLTQGNCTFESHSLETNQHMSFDFKMPIGTPVHAAADGRVFLVVEKYRDDIDQGFTEANLIGIEHQGGILTFYMHLMLNGATVAIDDQVSQGELIGHSGNTGDSSYPHLHFFAKQLTDACHDVVSKTADLALCPQIPISFSNSSPGSATMKEWVKYTSLPY